MDRELTDVLARMGGALVLAQAAEKALRLIMTFVLQKNPPLTIDNWSDRIETEERRTFGQFLSELKKRAGVDEGFDKLLTDFVTNRNRLVHDTDKIEGWDLSSEDGRKVAVLFLSRLSRQSFEIIKVLTGLTLRWQHRADLNVPVPDDDIFREIEEKYAPLVDEIFFEKE